MVESIAFSFSGSVSFIRGDLQSSTSSPRRRCRPAQPRQQRRHALDRHLLQHRQPWLQSDGEYSLHLDARIQQRLQLLWVAGRFRREPRISGPFDFLTFNSTYRPLDVRPCSSSAAQPADVSGMTQPNTGRLRRLPDVQLELQPLGAGAVPGELTRCGSDIESVARRSEATDDHGCRGPDSDRCSLPFLQVLRFAVPNLFTTSGSRWSKKALCAVSSGNTPPCRQPRRLEVGDVGVLGAPLALRRLCFGADRRHSFVRTLAEIERRLMDRLFRRGRPGSGWFPATRHLKHWKAHRRTLAENEAISSR